MTSFTRLFPSGTHFTAESTEAMQIKYLAQGNNILMSGFIKLCSVIAIIKKIANNFCICVLQYLGFGVKFHVFSHLPGCTHAMAQKL